LAPHSLQNIAIDTWPAFFVPLADRNGYTPAFAAT
jgi:hypothetical protein